MDDVEIYSIGNFIGIPSMSGEEAVLARAYVEALVDVPVLLVYGSDDGRVPVEPSVKAITTALESAGHSATVRIFEGADHTFRVRRPGDEWPRTAPGYPEAVIDWLASL